MRSVLFMNKVIPKSLWIKQVIHALTVTKKWVIHALTVTSSRINGHPPNKEPVVPVFKNPIVGAAHFGDNLTGCHPNRLHLPPIGINRKSAIAIAIALTCVTKFSFGEITSKDNYTTFGGIDCGQWLNEKKFPHKTWLLGFVSGINMMNKLHDPELDVDALAKINSAEQIFVWMDNYCQKNPLSELKAGSLSLFVELMKKK